MPTWIIAKTSQAVSEFEDKIFNNPQYSSEEDNEAQLIMNYLSEEIANNDEDNVWYIMEYKNGLWYPGELLGYPNALAACVRPCYRIDNNGIRPVLQRQRSHGGKRRKRGRKKTRRRKKRKRRRSRKHRKK